jgi:hypothetical protein
MAGMASGSTTESAPIRPMKINHPSARRDGSLAYPGKHRERTLTRQHDIIVEPTKWPGRLCRLWTIDRDLRGKLQAILIARRHIVARVLGSISSTTLHPAPA